MYNFTAIRCLPHVVQRSLALWMVTAALSAIVAPFDSETSANTPTPLPGVLGAPAPLPESTRVANVPGGWFARPEQPHPAVVRIVVPEGEMTSYGSGTLVDVRDQYGLVVTNWHVVRDSRGEVEVVFPDGFHSKARPLKVDADWDLAALIIWRPQVQPVKIADRAPQPGDRLAICGYGSGQYRTATGSCTQYYSPSLDLPQHMVELDVEARQGDSGGPIFNDRGELAGVLFGAGQGTTMGSFGGRVESFLASLAPDIGQHSDQTIARLHAPQMHPVQAHAAVEQPSPRATAKLEALPPSIAPPKAMANDGEPYQFARMANSPPYDDVKPSLPMSEPQPQPSHAPSLQPSRHAEQRMPPVESSPVKPVVAADWFDTARNVLAVIGAISIALQLVRVVR